MLSLLYNHVVLPPRLPGRQDGPIDEVQTSLVTRVELASRTLMDILDVNHRNKWDAIRRSLHACKVLNVGGKLDKKSILAEFCGIQHGDILIIHIAEQNAGLLIRRHPDPQNHSVIFESFEASALSEKVLASPNALLSDFPASAASIPHATFENPFFQDELARFLEQASKESIKRFAAHTDKAGSAAYESRDTVDPSLITQMLITLIEANGQRFYPTLIRKRVRDDVCWTEGDKPWRRCPLWLVLRVGLQSHLCTLCGGSQGRVHYKFMMCLVLAHFLNDSVGELSVDLLHILKAKLCRRLAKLEVERESAWVTDLPLYDEYFAKLGPIFDKSTRAAIHSIDATWSDYKKKICRRLHLLPRFAENEDLRLELPNSKFHLHKVMTQPLTLFDPRKKSAPRQLFKKYQASAAFATKNLEAFANQYFLLSERENEIEHFISSIPEPITGWKSRCIHLSEKIADYLTMSIGVYDCNPEQMSIKILTIMELWVSMDKCAVKAFDLLNRFHPGFSPEMLNVLQLPRLKEMHRLQGIQEYLQSRLELCSYNKQTIFTDPAKGCFGHRYFDESRDSARLNELYEKIQQDNKIARDVKEYEWKQLSEKYEALTRQISDSSCVNIVDEISQPATHAHNKRRCPKCVLEREARKIQIRAHEDPLPSKETIAKTVVFELAIPEALAAYRNATWKIIGGLALAENTEDIAPRLLIHEYSSLKPYTDIRSSTFTLASKTKSFLKTHYAAVRFPSTIEDVLLPNGLKYSYFDTSTKVWSRWHTQRPNFIHHCQLVTPSDSPFQSLHASYGSAIDGARPSSYEIIASQSQCPPGLNVHEFMAYQTLLAGNVRRWPTILIELGSSNLNFSSEPVATLVSYLAIQAGPSLEGDPLRVMHRVFAEEYFCKTLVHQIEQRLESIAPNFRETFCMDMLITLSLRLQSVSPNPSIISKAVKLLERARAVTHKWTILLRKEIQASKDARTARNLSRYMFMSAAHCKRTFTFLAEGGHLLNLRALRCFIECSISIQDSVAGDPKTFSYLSKTVLIRDLKLSYKMRLILSESVKATPEGLISAIFTFWPNPTGISRSYKVVQNENFWVQLVFLATEDCHEQIVHYHMIQGVLLIDGVQLGRLPREYQQSLVVQQLFESQILSIYPSPIKGMTYMLGFIMYDHHIHFGFRDGILFVRAYLRGKTLEFIPSQVFGNSSSFDLPAELVDKCVHWLDVSTGIMEVRRKPDIWKLKFKNWQIHTSTQTGKRGNVTLVDPNSRIFNDVAQVFDHFEYRRQLTVFQPVRGPLQVECRRLELSFFVNNKGLLQVRRFGAEIDVDQDAGTWYGLRSKLVLRDTTNPRLRSIIVPMGPISVRREGIHVTVEIQNDCIYGRYIINDVLGRLECAAEPRLLYLKAYLHALTSSVAFDKLTQRTGTEEALHILKSGLCQPWAPLTSHHYKMLIEIAKLTPLREYYPQYKKVMQRVLWNESLTTHIQHDGFRAIIESIIEKSVQLSKFALEKAKLPELDLNGDSHLTKRSAGRRTLYQRPTADFENSFSNIDYPHLARGRLKTSRSRRNVYEIVATIRSSAFRLPATSDLVGILQSWSNMDGYCGVFDKILLSDQLEIDFACDWGSLVKMCREIKYDEQDKYRLMFLFATMSFRNDIDMDIMRVLVAFAILEELKLLEPPQWPRFIQFRQNEIPHMSYLLQLLKPYLVPYKNDHKIDTLFAISAKQHRINKGLELVHEKEVETDTKAFATFLLDQWPCLEPETESFSKVVLIDLPPAIEVIRVQWRRMFQNFELSQHIYLVQQVLDRHRTSGDSTITLSIFENEESPPRQYHGNEVITLDRHLLRNASLTVVKPLNQSLAIAKVHLPISEDCEPNMPHEIQILENIISNFAASKSTVRQQYAEDLKKSLNAVKIIRTSFEEQRECIPSLYNIATQISTAEKAINMQFDQISKALQGTDRSIKWLQSGGIYPIVTLVTLLETLRSNSKKVFGSNMRKGLLDLALLITSLQRLLRIEDALLKNDGQKLREEQENRGHSNWNIEEYPDWILLEIDANILIRPTQVDVALATIQPCSGKNSVLQMNMGQGKTSCILPMAAVVLADTRRLMRVIIPKSLLLQTAQLLHTRLGNLLGREIRHIPFSRKTPTDPNSTQLFRKIHEDILDSSGVILALQEHILSFNLSGLQRLSDGRIEECKPMVKAQAWINNIARDIIDECDFTLAVKTQLIYPSGSQTSVDGHPHRWETAEALLSILESHLFNLQQAFPHSIEVVHRLEGGYPLIFFLRKDVENELISRILEDIFKGRTNILSMKDCTKPDRSAIKKFISQPKVDQGIVERVRKVFSDNPASKQKIYHLRGLLVHRILLLCIRKRWQVHYGTHPDRDPIAVPFQAKGLPSEQAEFGHIDVAIILTVLAFYYQGLNPQQLRQSLEHVVKSDDPSSAYNRWTQTAHTLPDSLREWNVINVDDEAQLMEMWQNVRYNIVVVNYFLNNFVFPKHAKQFHMKLQASGWDIPLFHQDAYQADSKSSKALTTGFSGTNDNKRMLPLTITQGDLPGLLHTSASVLTTLLEPRNRKYYLAADSYGRHVSEVDLLVKLSKMGIRLLIDAGAMILELDNFSLAKAWLNVYPESPAAVYFDKFNKAYVLYRQGHQIPLIASPFAENLGECLVYIDEAHTRGTDLKLPPRAQGALTLGPGITKDATVQGNFKHDVSELPADVSLAAMRLRQLATTQSVSFFAPPEVHQSILDVRRKSHGEFLDSSDVICWLIEQTCEGIEQFQPLYYSQGVDFCRRSQASFDYKDFLSDGDQREAYLGTLRQVERQTLEQLYDVQKQPRAALKARNLSPEISSFLKELNSRRKGFQDNGNAVQASALQEVEQEREVAFEVEAVREVKKPFKYSPLKYHGLHKDILGFTRTGKLAADSAGYEQVFITLRKTALGQKHGIGSEMTASRLFVSLEFKNTIALRGGRPNDNYQRQVNWILWSRISDTALILIPEEAEEILPLLHSAQGATHLLTYAAPITRKMIHFNNLDYYAVPPLPNNWTAPSWLKIELGIFAGRLYFDHDEYADICAFLGVREVEGKLTEPDPDEMNSLNESDYGHSTEPSAESPSDDLMNDAVVENAFQELNLKPLQSFTKKPLTFLHEWLAVRRKGQDFAHSPMGYVCQGKPLTRNHPFFSSVTNNPVPETEGLDKGASSRITAPAMTEIDTNVTDDEQFDGDMDYDDGEDDTSLWQSM